MPVVLIRGRVRWIHHYRPAAPEPPGTKPDAQEREWVRQWRALTESQHEEEWIRRVRDEYLRRLAIENGEIENEFALLEEAKDRICHEGMDTARYEDQDRKRRKPLSEPVLRQRLTDQYEAAGCAWQVAQARRPPTWSDLKEIHRRACGKRNAQEYRRIMPVVICNEFTGWAQRGALPWRVGAEVRRFMTRWNEGLARADAHPGGLAAFVHGHLATVHPWLDGNGRTTRLAVATTYLHHGWPPPVVRTARKQEYFETLRAGRGPRGSWIPLRDFLAEEWRVSTRALLDRTETLARAAGRDETNTRRAGPER